MHEAARADEEVRLVIDIMRFVQQTAALPANDQRKALDAVLAAHRKDASRVGTRLRLATLLALPQKPFSDPARAAALLEPIATGPDGALQRLASLLLGQVNDRLRERRRADQLNVQLEQLRAIERGLIERTR